MDRRVMGLRKIPAVNGRSVTYPFNCFGSLCDCDSHVDDPANIWQKKICQRFLTVSIILLQLVMLPFRFQILDGVPVSEQLVKAVQRAVLTGEMAAGEKFPSVRVIAQELRISPTTAHKAILELRDAGFLASRPGAGMVVVKPAGASREQLAAQLTP
ncbi:MAG: GntR family transcriptional regulator, partial [Verrucomicrobiaceae bacterium]